MEKTVLESPVEEPAGFGRQKFLVMRTLARLHECSEDALVESIDLSRPEVRDILRRMVSRNEADATPASVTTGKRKATFSLTLGGWREYMKSLGSIYELPE